MPNMAHAIDCQKDMPEHIRRKFFDRTNNVSNDVWVEWGWELYDPSHPDWTNPDTIEVQDWIIRFLGITVDLENGPWPTVLIKRWW